MTKRDRNALYVAVGVVVVGALVVLLAPIRTSSTEVLTGRVYAGAVWTLEHSGRGELIGKVTDRETGVAGTYEVRSVDRGDVARFTLWPGLRLGAQVAAGDTLGVLSSTASDRELAQLQTLEAIAASEAATFTEGAKESLVRAAERRLEQTTAMRDLQERIVSRLEELLDRSVVALDEVERARTELVSLEGEIAVLEADLEVLRTGSRPSEQRLARTRVEAAREQLVALSEQRNALAAVSPLSGVVTRPSSDSVLVRVTDFSRRVAVVPVPVELRAGTAVGTELFARSGWTAEVIHVNPAVQLVGGRSVVLVTCVADAGPEDLPDGALVEFELRGEPVLLRTRLFEAFRSLFSFQTWSGNAPRA